MPKTFENLAQRCVDYFLATMPQFKAVKSETANEKEQEKAYNFIKGIYESLNKNPQLLGLKNQADDCYPNWWTQKKEKPGLPAKIRSNIKSVSLFIESLYEIVHNGKADGDKITIAVNDCNVKPAVIKKFSGFGVENEKDSENYFFTFPKGALKGLKLLAKISMDYPQKSSLKIHDKILDKYFLFSRGIFDPRTPYMTEIFRSIFDNREAYDKLINYFENNNFIRLDNKEYSGSMKCDKVSFDYIKFYGKPEGKIGNCWKTRNFSGIEIAYDEMTQSQTRIGIHLPFFAEILENADKMSESLKKYVSEQNKCGGCRYCVQMDKTKTKPLRLVKVGENNICTVFTFGYQYNHFYEGMWLPDSVIELMDFIDKLFADRKAPLT